MRKCKFILVSSLLALLALPEIVLASACCVCFSPSYDETGGYYFSANSRTGKENTCDTEKCAAFSDEFGYECSIKEDSENCPGFCDVASAPEMTSLEDEFKFKDVVLGVTIPNLQFSAPPTKADTEGNIYIPWLAEYIKAIYNFLVVAISIVAVVMVIVAGAQIIASAGGPAKAQGYKRITQAVIGLLLAWGSYFIMYTINPNLTTFKSIKVKYIEPEEIVQDNPDDKNPDMGGVALPDTALNIQKKSGPRMSAVSGMPLSGSKIEKCFTIDEQKFYKFMTEDYDMSKFSDGSNGVCLISLFNSAKVKSVKFLGRSLTAHPSAATALMAVAEEIDDMDSPIVMYWKEPGRFATAGSYVNNSEPARYTKKCKEAKQDTVVVIDTGGTANRLYTSIARVMYGGQQSKTIVGGDLHALGMAIDVYAKMNLDFKGQNRPQFTNVPMEVAEAFMENGFAWGGGHWGRDPMHFEYHNPACYTKAVKPAYPTGNGCCAVVDFATYMAKKGKALPDYNECKNTLRGTDMSYENCMGEDGQPGSVWVQQFMQ